ncbi:MAG: alanine--tRNA ligase [Polyangiaceae bacterium]|jgi:alanyl-tRNA synthetase
MISQRIRSGYLDFYARNGHVTVPSAPLVPVNDATLLFVNSGMVPFKDLFLGKETREYKRAASLQKCLRVSGKHNDLDEVGRTARHHTFFEMLGSFSFGDYFRKEAIPMVHDVVTKVWGMDTRRLAFTVFGGDPSLKLAPDDEAREMWRKVSGVSDDRIIGLGAKDNFWQMGPVGPCGSNSEIHYYQGPDFPCAEERAGRSCKGPACDCDRWLEFWNTVFMQYEMHEGGGLTPLPAPSIDIGVGLERVSAILNGQTSNYHTDLFLPLLDAVGSLSGKQYRADSADWSSDDNISMRVIADHARATAFCMAEGVFPANTRREYVLRRLMRRGISHGELLGIKDVFFHKIVDAVIGVMSPAYPELREHRDTILSQTRREEEAFRATIEMSLARLDKMEDDLNNSAIWVVDPAGVRTLRGEAVFRLKDTYGCPVELISAVGKRRGWEIDEERYEHLLEEQQQRGRKRQKLGGKIVEDAYKALTETLPPTSFVGYTENEVTSKILALLKRNGEGVPVRVDSAAEGDEVDVVLERTPFYAEAGGQVGDIGSMTAPAGTVDVTDTTKPFGDVIVHSGVVLSGVLKVGDPATLRIDDERRRRIRAAHSATHLLHHALRAVLGTHVAQKGSRVEADRLRFDFSHDGAPPLESLQSVEDIVNRMVRDNVRSNTEVLPIAEAKSRGAIAFFGEKYGSSVRAIKIHDSYELCGGTHVSATGDIGLVKVVSSTPLGSGVRRIEALTGAAALGYLRDEERLLQKAASSLKVPASELPTKVEGLLRELGARDGIIADLKHRLAFGQGADSKETIRTTPDGVKVLVARAPFGDPKSLREMGDRWREKLKSGIVLIGGVDGETVSLLCMVTPDLVTRYNAGDLIRTPAQVVGGKGGGKAETAQAGGKNPMKLDAALDTFVEALQAS